MAKVLLIDAQPHILDLLRGKFEQEGFEVLTADRGEEGVAAALAHRPDLIVLDERLQDATGRPLADRLRDEVPLRDVPLILLTPRTSTGHGTGNGSVDSVLQLPFRPSQLVALARETI